MKPLVWKTLFFAALLLAIITGTISAGDAIVAKKFKVTFTVTYNELTLEQAAAKEKEFRERYKDACSVDVKLEELLTVSGVQTIGNWGVSNSIGRSQTSIDDSSCWIQGHVINDGTLGLGESATIIMR